MNDGAIVREPEIAAAPNRAYFLRDAIASLRASERDRSPSDRLGYAFIDCPPSLGILTLNALVAADAALVPVRCEFFALEAITQLKETIDFVRSSLNPSLEIHGVVLTMHDSRTKLAGEVGSEVRQLCGQKVYETVIPRDMPILEAPSHGKPLLLYDHKSAGSHAYMDLAAEMLSRERAIRVTQLKVGMDIEPTEQGSISPSPSMWRRFLHSLWHM